MVLTFKKEKHTLLLFISVPNMALQSLKICTEILETLAGRARKVKVIKKGLTLRFVIFHCMAINTAQLQ